MSLGAPGLPRNRGGVPDARFPRSGPLSGGVGPGSGLVTWWVYAGACAIVRTNGSLMVVSNTGFRTGLRSPAQNRLNKDILHGRKQEVRLLLRPHNSMRRW